MLFNQIRLVTIFPGSDFRRAWDGNLDGLEVINVTNLDVVFDQDHGRVKVTADANGPKFIFDADVVGRVEITGKNINFEGYRNGFRYSMMLTRQGLYDGS